MNGKGYGFISPRPLEQPSHSKHRKMGKLDGPKSANVSHDSGANESRVLPALPPPRSRGNVQDLLQNGRGDPDIQGGRRGTLQAAENYSVTHG